jgi:hypothetical protein
MTQTVNQPRTSIRIARLDLREPWSGLVMKLSGFPAKEEEVAALREFLRTLMSLLLKRMGGQVETFLQFTQLHLGDGARRLASRGRDWLPRQGLGVWPDREPPHSWTLDELRDLLPEEKVRPLMDIVLRLTAPNKEGEVRDAMLGMGTLLQFVIPDSAAFLSAARELLLPPITDPSYTAFPFYVPLLQGASVTTVNSDEVDRWMCGAHAMFRESPEDEGILLLTRTALDEILLETGAVKTPSISDEWSVPVGHSTA